MKNFNFYNKKNNFFIKKMISSDDSIASLERAILESYCAAASSSSFEDGMDYDQLDDKQLRALLRNKDVEISTLQDTDNYKDMIRVQDQIEFVLREEIMHLKSVIKIQRSIIDKFTTDQKTKVSTNRPCSSINKKTSKAINSSSSIQLPTKIQAGCKHSYKNPTVSSILQVSPKKNIQRCHNRRLDQRLDPRHVRGIDATSRRSFS
jgi:hypothetical protein